MNPLAQHFQITVISAFLLCWGTVQIFLAFRRLLIRSIVGSLTSALKSAFLALSADTDLAYAVGKQQFDQDVDMLTKFIEKYRRLFHVSIRLDIIAFLHCASERIRVVRECDKAAQRDSLRITFEVEIQRVYKDAVTLINRQRWKLIST
jgi:hypothetical protein